MVDTVHHLTLLKKITTDHCRINGTMMFTSKKNHNWLPWNSEGLLKPFPVTRVYHRSNRRKYENTSCRITASHLSFLSVTGTMSQRVRISVSNNVVLINIFLRKQWHQYHWWSFWQPTITRFRWSMGQKHGFRWTTKLWCIVPACGGWWDFYR